MRRNSEGISSGAAPMVRGWRRVGGAGVAVGCAAFATAAGNGTGVIRCEIDVSAAGYSHR